MAIPESQLEIWSHQGSITQSSETYNTIRNALNESGTPFWSKDYEVFLQGSYSNDTNIYAESDVDIVIKLKSTFAHDAAPLAPLARLAFDRTYEDAEYPHADFKRDVLDHLAGKYGAGVFPGNKAILVPANGTRRKTDVVVAIDFRKYRKSDRFDENDYVSGLCFFTDAGDRIINYPKLHASNCTTKHKNTNGWFKPMVRILKNTRKTMVAKGYLDAGVAPSYYLEGLLYNVPNEMFGDSYQDTFIRSLNWIWSAERSIFTCANGQYRLLHATSPVTWRAESCTEFLTALIKFWNEWR